MFSFQVKTLRPKCLKLTLTSCPRSTARKQIQTHIPVSQSPMSDRTLRVKSQVPGVGHWVHQTSASCPQLPQAGFLSPSALASAHRVKCAPSCSSPI